MRVFSVDVGTTGAKVMLLDADGKVLGRAFREYPVNCPAAGQVEQDAEMVLQTVVALLEETAKAGKSDMADAICFSVQGDAVIPVDGADRPLLPAILGMDYRSAPQMDWCEAHLNGRRLFEKTGLRPHPIVSLGKIMWVEQHRPDIAGKTRCYLTYDGFLIRRLGGDGYVTDLTMASRSMGCDLQTGRWDREILSKAGVDINKLPRIVRPGTSVGRLNKALARRIGLKNLPALITGGHDQCCASVGAGALRPGLVVDSHGTAEVLSASLNSPLVSDIMYDSQYPCYRHAVPDKFFTFALNHSGGIVLRWYRDILCSEEQEQARRQGVSAYDLIVGEMAREPSGLLFLPHFNGSGPPNLDLRAKGALVGLTLATGKPEISRALLEGMAFEMRLNADRFLQIGIPVEEVRCVGGGAAHPASLQLKADVLGKPVSVLSNGQAASMGAAIIALAALGAYNSVDSGVKTLVGIAETYSPDPRRAELYDKMYEAYKALYPALKPVCTLLE